MSYSFSMKAPSAAAAMSAIKEQVSDLVRLQSSHAADQALVLLAAHNAIDLVGEDTPGTEIMLVVSGSLSGKWNGQTLERCTAVQFSISASRIPLPAETLQARADALRTEAAAKARTIIDEAEAAAARFENWLKAEAAAAVSPA